MPADVPGLSRLGGQRTAVPEAAYQAKYCRLRIGDHRDKTNVGLGRRDMHSAAETLDPISRYLNVVDFDIPHPSWPGAHLPAFLRQVHQSAQRDLSGAKHGVSQIWRRRVVCAPTHYVAVERLGTRHVRGHEFVPGETSGIIDHVGFSVRACEISRRIEPARLPFPAPT